jgi:hypothetical protein
MTQDTKQSYRGVLCVCCTQPIPVAAFVAIAEPESSEEHQRVRVFSVRCRVCEKERPYRSTDILEFEGTPRPRGHAHHGSSPTHKPAAIRRAANA